MILRYEFRCGAPTGRGRTCGKLLGKADNERFGFALSFSGDWLYPTDDMKDVCRFNCPIHGEGEINPRFLDNRKPRKKPYVELVTREI